VFGLNPRASVINSDGGIGPIPTKWRGICQTDSNNWDNFHHNKLTSLSLFNELGVSSCLLILVYNFDLYDLRSLGQGIFTIIN
jgi:hypothetical protein